VLGETIKTAHEIETGQLCPDEVMVNDLLRAYDVTAHDEVQGLMRLLDDAAHRRGLSHDHATRWLSRLAACHRAAHAIVTYSAAFIPRILRTPAYGSQLLTTPHSGLWPDHAETDTRCSAAHHGTPVIVVLDESALMRAVGPPALMRDQLHHILNVATGGTLRVRVLPLTAPVAPAVSTLTELWLSCRRLFVEEAHGALYTADPRHSAARHQLLHTVLANSLSPAESLDRLRRARDAFATATPTSSERPFLLLRTGSVPGTLPVTASVPTTPLPMPSTVWAGRV
jgi:hypothetical protein